jgi:glucose-6-phosphate isomerase
MSLQSINPTQTNSWIKLQKHYQQMKDNSIKELFANDENRAKKFHIEWDQFIVDYSKNNITQETIDLLLQLAQEVDLQDAIQKQFSGEAINKTENRAVLHTALRMPENSEVFVDNKNVIPEIFEVKNKIKQFSNEIISGEKKDIQANHLPML